MVIIKNSVWEISDTDDLKNGLYRVLDLNADLDIVILFELQDKRISKPFGLSLRRFDLMVRTRTE